MRVFFTEEVAADLDERLKDPEKIATVRAVLSEMDEDDWVYLTARKDGMSDQAARDLIESIGQMREAERHGQA